MRGCEEKMIFAGVDIGAATAKTVILSDNRILGYSIMPTGYDVKLAAGQVTLDAIEKAGLSKTIGELDYIISTGYARNAVGFAHRSTTEIICHAKGAHFAIPETRTVIDIGGQDSKAIELDEDGNVIDFVMNDKCAAGTGRFLDVMADVLQVGSIDNMGPLSLKSRNPCSISNTCTIFAESEVVSLRAEGNSREDLLAGVHKAIASRVAVMARRLKIRSEVIFTGGVAKNVGVKRALENEFGMDITLPDEPQIIGALGAALLAAEA
jgi:predicted CoA-substrate-specific enzyme activase